MVNLLVDLDERYSREAAHAVHKELGAAGFDVMICDGADDRTLAWIDEAFGGTWSSEAFAASNVIVSREGIPVAFATFDPRAPRFGWLRGEGAVPGTGIFGPFGVDAAYRGDTLGSLVLTLALCELRAREYTRALIAAVGGARLVAYYERVARARIAEEFDPFQFGGSPVRTVILASGSGTNAQAVFDAVAAGLPLDIRTVVTNRSDAGVIDRAARAGLSCDIVMWDRAENSRTEFDELLLEAVGAYQPDLVLLLGWMHLLDERFVKRFPNLLNVHPAFLPHDARRDTVGVPDGSTIQAFRGPRAVADAVRASSEWVGASFHVVTMETDRGAVIARKPLKVLPGEDADRVLERLHPLEHELVIAGIKRWLYER
jgi:phosphoribosylglycinamide formyltransferase 1